MSVVNTNVKSLTAQASLSNVNKSMASAMERLSTGSRINSAKDDAAGLAISLRMTSDIRGFAVAIRNANDGISMTQTAEGGLGQINDMLQRMRELAVQSSNGSASADNRAASQLEVTQLKQEIDNIASRTNFNGIKLLDGSAAKLELQTGVNAGDLMTVQIAAAGTKDLGLGARSSLTATGFTGTAQGALAKNIAAGDLTINGVAIGATSADDDLVSASPLEVATLTVGATTAGAAGTIIFGGVTVVHADGATAVANATATATALNANATFALSYSSAADGLGNVIVTATSAGNKTDLANATNTGNAAATSVSIAQGGGDKSSSAIAKVAAINRVSAQTNVTATVSATTVSGSIMVAAAGTGTIMVNGVKTASFSTTTDAGVNRANTTAAINLISDQTGVRAVDTGDVNKGVVLVAADGRNITTSFQPSTAAGFTAVSTGIGAAGVTTGGYTLSSSTGAPVVVGSTSNGTVANAGLTAGTYAANVSIVTSAARTAAATNTAPARATTGLLEAGTMKINGIAIDAAITADDTASDATATSSTKAASAIAVAAAINKKSAQTGVVAKAESNVIVGSGFVAAARSAATLQLNGTAISIVTTTSTTRGDLVTTLNKFTGQTGVVASDNGSGLTLTATDGRNISMAYGGDTAAAITDLGILAGTAVVTQTTATPAASSAVTTYSRVSLSSDLTFALEGGSDGNVGLEKLGFKAGTIGGSNNGVKIASVNVSTQAGAQVAITALDAAMKSVSMSQAQLGAFQNRLDAVVSNLTVANLNMNASRSRIQDTDYATESTKLAKAQIISQAATAMLAQANQSGQSVLALLK
jgi:flagellin